MSQSPPPPIHDELLNKSIELLEGPVSSAAERLLSSTIVLAPLSFSLSLGLRALKLVRGAADRSKP